MRQTPECVFHTCFFKPAIALKLSVDVYTAELISFLEAVIALTQV